jgi:hypothetical protein
MRAADEVMKVLAILCSDIHLCHLAPVARSAEPDWYAAMKRPLEQLWQLSSAQGAPLVIAGDIFDRWDTKREGQPELTNFAIEVFSQFNWGVFAIPGQHDLPNHRLDEIHRSAFWTLIRSGKVQMLKPGYESRIGRLALHGFPWGVPVKPKVELSSGVVHLAVVHAYIWKAGCSYPGADEEQHAVKYQAKLKGFSAAVFGDNHKGFMIGDRLMNCGTLLRRKSDEKDYRPQVGLLYDDGHIEPHFLDTSADRFLEEPSAKVVGEESDADVSSFLDHLKRLKADPLNFREAVTRALDQKNLPPESNVRRFALESMA